MTVSADKTENKCISKTHIPTYGALKRKKRGRDFTVSESIAPKMSKNLSGILATPCTKFHAGR